MRARPSHREHAVPSFLSIGGVAVCALAAVGFAATHAAQHAPAKDKIVFDPKVPSKVSKTFTVEHHLALQHLKLEDNGVEQLAQQELNLDTKEVVHTIDKYEACADGRPTLLQRAFEEASLHVDVTFREGNGSDKVATDAIDAKSPFENVSVLFTWVPEEKGYGKLYDVVEGDETYLPNLSQDLDLLALLPGHAVAPGDEWTIDPTHLVDWVSPGGEIPKAFGRRKDDRFVRTLSLGVGGGLSMVFGGDVKGQIRARYEGPEQKGDQSLAVIALDVDVQTERDQTQVAQNMLASAEFLDGVKVRRSMAQWKMKAEGKARWNMSLNRFESLELAGREEIAYELLVTMSGGGRSLQNLAMSGGIRVSAQASPALPKPKIADKDKAPAPDKTGNPVKDPKDER
jgi:hypothetical protein